MKTIFKSENGEVFEIFALDECDKCHRLAKEIERLQEIQQSNIEIKRNMFDEIGSLKAENEQLKKRLSIVPNISAE